MAFAHHFYWSPDIFLSRLLRWGFQYRLKKTVLSQGKIASYEYPGSPGAKTVVIFHGIGVSAVHFYQLLIRFRLKGYRVLALDLPSHGLSSDLSVPLTPRALYQTLCEWVQAQHCEPFLLIGNSLGGLLALKYAFFHPQQVSHLVVNSPAGGFHSPQGWERLKADLLIQTLDQSAEFLKRVYHQPPFYLPWLTLFFYLNMHRLGILQLLQSAEWKDFQIFRTARSQQLPILFVWGKSEKLLTPDSLLWYQQHLGGPIEFEYPENLGHCAHMECPAWFVKRIDTFWKGPVRNA